MCEIPKVIHYCWFGGNPLPEEAIRCIESWKKYCPDYEIKEWNESNYDIQAKCDYVKQAYQAEKWAYISDYARFDILYQYGGVYFDTDVELIKPIDTIVNRGPFMGCEARKLNETEVLVNTGLGIGAYPRMSVYREMLDNYEHTPFYLENKRLNLMTVVTRMTSILKQYGYIGNNKLQQVADVWVYPVEYFCPQNFYTSELIITRNTVSIHHYSSSWMSASALRTKTFVCKYEKYMGRKISKIIGTVISLPLWINEKAKIYGYFGLVKYFIWRIITIAMKKDEKFR